MTGGAAPGRRTAGPAGTAGARRGGPDGPREFPPALDLVAPVIGWSAWWPRRWPTADRAALAVARTLAGAAFLGAVTDAMLLGHWYLVQPGLGRGRLNELVRWATIVWPFEVAALLWPTGMPAVLSGRIKDGYGGILGWFWVACAVTTLGAVLRDPGRARRSGTTRP